MFRAAFRAKPTARLYIARRLCSQYPNTCSTLALVLLLFARPQPIAMSPASRGTSRSQPLSAASPAGCPMMSVLTCSLPCQTMLGCQVFCMLFCLRSFSIQICRKYTNNYLNINELFLEIPCRKQIVRMGSDVLYQLVQHCNHFFTLAASFGR